MFHALSHMLMPSYLNLPWVYNLNPYSCHFPMNVCSDKSLSWCWNIICFSVYFFHSFSISLSLCLYFSLSLLSTLPVSLQLKPYNSPWIRTDSKYSITIWIPILVIFQWTSARINLWVDVGTISVSLFYYVSVCLFQFLTSLSLPPLSLSPLSLSVFFSCSLPPLLNLYNSPCIRTDSKNAVTVWISILVIFQWTSTGINFWIDVGTISSSPNGSSKSFCGAVSGTI